MKDVCSCCQLDGESMLGWCLTLGCSNLNTIDKVTYKHQKFISHSLGAWEIKNQRSDRFSIWSTCSWMVIFSQWPHMAGRERELSQEAFIGALNPVHEGRDAQRPHLLIMSPWVLGFQHVNFGRPQTFNPWQVVVVEQRPKWWEVNHAKIPKYALCRKKSQYNGTMTGMKLAASKSSKEVSLAGASEIW